MSTTLNKFVIPIAVVIVIASITLSAVSCSGITLPGAPATTPSSNPTVSRPAQAVPVPTATTAAASSARNVPVTAKVVGNLVSATQVSLAFQVGGRLKEMSVQEGARVTAGTLLASLDTSLLELQVAQAKAAFDLANANWNRTKAGPAVDDITIAKASLDRAKAAVDQAQAAYDRIGGSSNPMIGLTSQSLNLQQATLSYQAALAQYNLTVNHPTTAEREVGLAQVAQAQAALDLARQNLTNARIVAPIDGTILWIGPKVGESVTSATTAIILADLSQMQVQVNVDENTLANIRAGQAATIYVDAIGGKSLTGRVKKIGLLATTTGSIVSVPIWIDIDKGDAPVYPGLSATV